MKRVIIGSLATIAMSMSLNAAVYATVDGTEVTDKDVASLLRAMPGAKFEALQKDQQKRVIDQAIERKLLSKEAIKSGIEKDAEYKKTLSSIKGDLALEIWMKRVFEKIKISEKDAKAYFDKNKDKFVKQATTKARHILVKSEAEAKAIIKELKGLKGEALTKKFIELAKTKSTGPSGKNGGDLGWFNAKQMVKPFSDAAFGQKKGEITKTPVKTQFGYHVILTEDKKGGEKVKFADAKVQIENGLKMEQFRKDVAAKAKDLRKKAKIVIK
ncbi:peptidylprolyl isomerase [Sulfurospirillum arcachonense]|uniref:peptidylprolyl isomerase n=1 Tax=Sulfurospirillum arcachonense TaxID=57666 RepID=UPI00046895C7|nr:peptidylprolyl isomerase [Sulfurospirillum arcachonense]